MVAAAFQAFPQPRISLSPFSMTSAGAFCRKSSLDSFFLVPIILFQFCQFLFKALRLTVKIQNVLQATNISTFLATAPAAMRGFSISPAEHAEDRPDGRDRRSCSVCLQEPFSAAPSTEQMTSTLVAGGTFISPRIFLIPVMTLHDERHLFFCFRIHPGSSERRERCRA